MAAISKGVNPADEMFAAYRKIRLKELALAMVGVIIGCILVVFLFGPTPNDWENILYGVNRFYLLALITIGIAVLVSAYRFLTNSDKRKILRLVERHPDSSFEILADLQNGMLIAPRGADSFCVAGRYSLIRCRGKYHLIQCTDILRLGCQKQYILGSPREKLVCLLKSGVRYEMNFPTGMSMLVAEQLKRVVVDGKDVS